MTSKSILHNSTHYSLLQYSVYNGTDRQRKYFEMAPRETNFSVILFVNALRSKEQGL